MNEVSAVHRDPPVKPGFVEGLDSTQLPMMCEKLTEELTIKFEDFKH